MVKSRFPKGRWGRVGYKKTEERKSERRQREGNTEKRQRGEIQREGRGREISEKAGREIRENAGGNRKDRKENLICNICQFF